MAFEASVFYVFPYFSSLFFIIIFHHLIPGCQAAAEAGMPSFAFNCHLSLSLHF
jgi:hypothetical protein